MTPSPADPQRRLIFVIGPPRGGTTLLLRMLNAHPDVAGAPELHLVTPLAHLGYFDWVERAPYDPFQTHLGHKALVQALPNGEADYLDALRAATDHLYDALRGDRLRVVDKTPAYALVLPFLSRLYPRATYVVLTRHPFAVWTSYARSFFDDDWETAYAHNPILERYVPSIARFLRRDDVPHRIHVRYEDLVASPESTLTAICECAEISFDPGMVEYGNRPAPGAGPGDPIGVDQASRPETGSITAWADEVVGDPERRAMLDRLVQDIPDQDLETWGVPRAHLWEALDGATDRGPRRRPWDRHHLKRRLLLAARHQVRTGPLGPVVKRVRFGLDVLLR